MELADIGMAPRREEKVGTLEEAVGLIKNGDMLAFGGIHSHNGPMALIRQMIRSGIKDLHAIGNVSAGMPADILIGGGCVDTFTVCYVGLEHLGFAPRFRKAAEERKIKIIDGDEIYYVLGLKAGAVGLPFVPHPPGHEARDNPKFESTYARTTDPYTGREVIVSPAIAPDVGIIHAAQCDPFGNVVHLGSVVADDLIAKASARTIVTTEEIVPLDSIKRDPKRTSIPGHYVDLVVEVPYGAHPLSCHGVYNHDEPHIVEYRDADIDAYLQEYVFGVEDHFAYLEKFGIERLMALRESL
jgi:glutaconate CoA-transferase subunit A